MLAFAHGDKVKSYRIVSANNEANVRTQAEPLGEGGSGVVFLAEQELRDDIKIKRAIKFFVYSDKIAALTAHRDSGPISASQFFEELVNVAAVRHENLIKVIDVGVYTPESASSNQIPYIVTDYVCGPTLQRVMDNGDLKLTLQDASEHLLDFLLALCRGVAHLHSKHLYHCDIAPKNIFLEGVPPQQTVVLGDLGVGKLLDPSSIDSDDEVFVAGTKDYSPLSVRKVLTSRIPRRDLATLQPHWDLYAIAHTGLNMLRVLPTDAPAEPWQEALKELLTAVENGTGPHAVTELEERIEWLRPIHRTVAAVPELTESFPSRRPRLVPVQPTITSARIRRLLHHPGVLRLKQVPQLMMGDAVFAGANHTRYEHSLGAFENMRQYLAVLANSKEFLQHFNQPAVETALVSAALCNLADYPFAHVLRALGDCGQEMFSSFNQSTLLQKLLSESPPQGGASLESIIRKHFPSVNLSSLTGLLAGNTTTLRDPAFRFMHSLLDGSLGVRIVDYLRRDAWHLGISQSDPIDLDELLEHIVFHDGSVAVTSAGLSVVEQIVTQRYWMYKRIYWNQPNRALHAMIRHLLIEGCSLSSLSQSKLLETALWGNETHVLNLLKNAAAKENREDLVDLATMLLADRPVTFEQAFQINRAESEASMRVLCDKLADLGATELAKVCSSLRSSISCVLDLRDDKVDVLLDIPQWRRRLGEDVNVLTHTRGVVPLQDVSGIVYGVHNGFARDLQRVRVFVHPRHRDTVRSDNSRLQTAIKQALGELC